MEANLGKYNDALIADKHWGIQYISRLVRGGDEGAPYIGAESAYELRAKAYDGGNPESILDAVQLDGAVMCVRDVPARLAIRLAIAGESIDDIGHYIRDRKRNRTGRKLVEDGIRLMWLGERVRGEERHDG